MVQASVYQKTSLLPEGRRITWAERERDKSRTENYVRLPLYFLIANNKQKTSEQ